MTEAFRDLSNSVLCALADTLERAPHLFPLTESDIYSQVSRRGQRRAVAAAFAKMAEMQMNATATAFMLRTLIEERAGEAARGPKVQPVWSGLNRDGTALRAMVVLQDLFKEAKEEVWLSTYNLTPGGLMAPIISALAHRLDRGELKQVRLFLNIILNKERHQEMSDAEVVVDFRETFISKVWPGKVMPEVFYYEKSLIRDWRAKKHNLHAKAVMIDERKVLITSANFSEAAQERNIEAGVLIEDQLLTQTYRRNFQRLVDEKLVKSIFDEDDKD